MATMPQFTPEQLEATRAFFATNPNADQIYEAARANNLSPEQVAAAWSQATGGRYKQGLRQANQYLSRTGRDAPNMLTSATAPSTKPPKPIGSAMADFSASPLAPAGSYKTDDWVTLLAGGAAGGVQGALSAAGINEAIRRLQSLGETGLTDYTNLAKASTQDIVFNPYAITSSLGSTRVNPDGSISSTLTPQQQANVDAAMRAQAGLYDFSRLPDTSGIQRRAFTGAETQLGQIGAGQEDLAALRAGYGSAAQGMMGLLGGSTTDMANKLFEQQQAMRTPEQERQALALENRLRAQGRLGTSTAAYGGTPEQLAMAKAVQEQQAADAFNSMTQAEQMATSQQARALGLGSATSSLAQVQQGLKAGDIANAQGLFGIGSAAANLPLDMQGKMITQAGLLQAQALAPAAAQLQQLQAAGTLGQQRANAAYQQGSLFAGTVGAGLQERLTAESAAAATRTKQYDTMLKAYASQGGQTGQSADLLQQLIQNGITKVGGFLYNAAGTLLGKASDLIGGAATNLWDTIENNYNTQYYTGGVNPYDLDWEGLSKSTGTDSNILKEALDKVVSWF